MTPLVPGAGLAAAEGPDDGRGAEEEKSDRAEGRGRVGIDGRAVGVARVVVAAWPAVDGLTGAGEAVIAADCDDAPCDVEGAVGGADVVAAPAVAAGGEEEAASLASTAL